MFAAAARPRSSRFMPFLLFVPLFYAFALQVCRAFYQYLDIFAKIERIIVMHTGKPERMSD
jgi:hypothetical protein